MASSDRRPDDRLLAYDPVFPPKKAAEYLGIRRRSLYRYNIERQPMPSTGTKRPAYRYRLSALNAFLDRLKDLKAHANSARA